MTIKKGRKKLNTREERVKSDCWMKLSSKKKPFFVLAPMANVTDAAFRAMIAKYGKPDVMWTEFVSADGLVSPIGRKKLIQDLMFSPKERPIIAQVFTANPEKMKGAAALIAELGFDGLDINMGCPDRAVEKQGGGAALIKNPKLALEILRAARQGVLGGNIGGGKIIPVSVKTRIGYGKNEISTWIALLLEQKLPVLTVHLRTRKELSESSAHWELMPEIVALRNKISPGTLIIGNGDVQSLAQAKELAEKSGCDGVMIGRGIFGRPWFFKEIKEGGGTEVERAKRLKIMVEHAEKFEKIFRSETKKSGKPFDIMKKHFKAYVSGWDGAKELRAKLMQTKNSAEVKKIVGEFLR